MENNFELSSVVDVCIYYNKVLWFIVCMCGVYGGGFLKKQMRNKKMHEVLGESWQ